MTLKHIIEDLYNFDFTTNTFADKKHENAIQRIFEANGLVQIDKTDSNWSILTDKENRNKTIQSLKGSFIFISQPFGSQKSPDFIICVDGYILWIECKSGKKLVWNTGYPKTDVMVVFSCKSNKKTTLFFGQSTELIEKNPNFEVEYEKMDKVFKKFCKDEFHKEFDSDDFSFYMRRMLEDKTKYHSSEVREDFLEKTKSILGL